MTCRSDSVMPNSMRAMAHRLSPHREPAHGSKSPSRPPRMCVAALSLLLRHLSSYQPGLLRHCGSTPVLQRKTLSPNRTPLVPGSDRYRPSVCLFPLMGSSVLHCPVWDRLASSLAGLHNRAWPTTSTGFGLDHPKKARAIVKFWAV